MASSASRADRETTKRSVMAGAKADILSKTLFRCVSVLMMTLPPNFSNSAYYRILREGVQEKSGKKRLLQTRRLRRVQLIKSRSTTKHEERPATCDIRLAGWQGHRSGWDAACFFSGKEGGTSFLASPQVASRASQVPPFVPYVPYVLFFFLPIAFFKKAVDFG